MKKILFLPTWRQNKYFNIFDSKFNYAELDKLLIECNAILGFNFHPTTVNKNVNLDLNKFNSIKILNSLDDEMNHLLGVTDILITDYSSLYADFLIYNRPIIFAKFDHESYIKEIDLFVDYDKDLPGQKVNNWHELLGAIKELLINNNDSFVKHRNHLHKKIYTNLDGKARKRIANFILGEL